MIDNEVKDIFLLIMKIGAITFAVFHFMVALIMLRQITTMKHVIRTKGRGCIVFFSLLHIVILLIVLVMIVLIPVK